MNSIAISEKLPLRNIQIEVRQVQHNSQDRSWAQDQQSSTVQQQVLVLNGRSAVIALRSNTPYRLMQTRFRNGAPELVQGTVLLDASTGFLATARWDGTNLVELELAATQASAPSSWRHEALNTTASVNSSLVVPLGEWTTVAQSHQDSRQSSSGWGGQGAESAQKTHELQVRLTVR